MDLGMIRMIRNQIHDEFERFSVNSRSVQAKFK